MTAAAKRSVFSPSYATLALISGAMYPGVPRTDLNLWSTYLLTEAAKPKSAILSWKFQSKRRFSGLRSLCAIPLECMYDNPSMSYLKQYLEISSLNLPVCATYSKSSPPLANSTTITTLLDLTPFRFLDYYNKLPDISWLH